MIDGHEGLDAVDYMAGRVGCDPSGKTLRQLCVMELGQLRMRRLLQLELSSIVLPTEGYDIGAYLWFGQINSAKKGSGLTLSPKLEAAVQKEMARIKAEHGDSLPGVSF